MELALALAEIPWELAGDEEGQDDFTASRLLSTLEMGGTWHHLEAIEVRTSYDEETSNHTQEAVQYDLDPALDAARVILGDYLMQTTEIKGRHYVIVMTPFVT